MRTEFLEAIRRGSPMRGVVTDLLASVPNIPVGHRGKWFSVGKVVEEAAQKQLGHFQVTDIMHIMEYFVKTRYSKSEFLHQHIQRTVGLQNINRPAAYLQAYLNSTDKPCTKATEILMNLILERHASAKLDDSLSDIMKVVVSAYHFDETFIKEKHLRMVVAHLTRSEWEHFSSSDFFNLSMIVIKKYNRGQTISSLCSVYLPRAKFLTYPYFVEAVTLIRHLPPQRLKEECLLAFSLEMSAFLSPRWSASNRLDRMPTIVEVSQVLLELAICIKDGGVPPAVKKVAHQIVLFVGEPEHEQFLRHNSSINAQVCWSCCVLSTEGFPDIAVPKYSTDQVVDSPKWSLLDDLLYRSSQHDSQYSPIVTKMVDVVIPKMGLGSAVRATGSWNGPTPQHDDEDIDPPDNEEFTHFLQHAACRCVRRFVEVDVNKHTPTDLRRILFAASTLNQLSYDLLDYCLKVVERDSVQFQEHSNAIVRLVNAVTLWRPPHNTTSNKTPTQLLLRLSEALNHECVNQELARVWISSALRCKVKDLPVLYHILDKWVSGNLRLEKASTRESLLQLIYEGWVSRPREVQNLRTYLRNTLSSSRKNTTPNELLLVLKCLRKLHHENDPADDITADVARQMLKTKFNPTPDTLSLIVNVCATLGNITPDKKSDLVRILTKKANKNTRLASCNDLFDIGDCINALKVQLP
eukprot:TRINITY_DN2128_c0_g1_i4.p1 TRINITY_DN2128_c0_g1~~TRINITY_DN2128_c0_g1_i4.p1  ORF type:complete len:693 (+),score=80.73 TRINITY_DN2128_c0_g1_i4:97-2175(+)